MWRKLLLLLSWWCKSFFHTLLIYGRDQIIQILWNFNDEDRLRYIIPILLYCSQVLVRLGCIGMVCCSISIAANIWNQIVCNASHHLSSKFFSMFPLSSQYLRWTNNSIYHLLQSFGVNIISIFINLINFFTLILKYIKDIITHFKNLRH